MKTKSLFMFLRKFAAAALAGVLSFQSLSPVSGQTVTAAEPETASETAELPNEGGGNRIEDIRVAWVTDEDDKETLHVVKDDTYPFSTKIRLDAALSGQYPYAPGEIRIRVPKYIWKDRKGLSTGEMSLSVPEAPDDKAQFNYTEEENFILLTNTKTLPAASSLYFEFSVDELMPIDIRDTAADYFTSPFYGIIEVDTHDGSLISMHSNEIRADLDTRSQVLSANVYANKTCIRWPSAWPASLKPENPDDYVYVDWYSYCYVSGSQVYNLDFQGEFGCLDGALVLGQERASYEVSKIRNGKYFGVRGEQHTYAAYPKAAFWKEQMNVSCRVSYHLEDVDDGKTSSASARAQTYLIFRDFVPPPGHFEIFKYGGNNDLYEDGYEQDDIADYASAINRLAMGESADFSYKIVPIGFGWPSTLRDDWQDCLSDNAESGIPDNSCYGYKPYTMSVMDQDIWFNEQVQGEEDEKARLNPGEYEFLSLRLDEMNRYDYVQFEESGGGYYESETGGVKSGVIQTGEWGYRRSSEAFPDLKIYGKKASGEWICYGLYSKGKLSAEHGASAEELTLYFPEGILEYKAEVTTTAAGMIWRMYPTIRLFGTGGVKKQAQALLTDPDWGDQVTTTLTNRIKMDVIRESGDLIARFEIDADNDKKGTDILGSSSQRVQMSQSVKKTVNDSSSRVIDIDYTSKVSLYTSAESIEDFQQLAAEGLFTEVKEGIFYDLLPAGLMPLTDTIRLRENDSLEDVQIIENYRNSGRTMLIVKAALSPSYRTGQKFGLSQVIDEPVLNFTARYCWDSLGDYGRSLENHSAFESLSGPVGTIENYTGEPDDPAFGNHTASLSSVGSSKELMTGISVSDKEGDRFIYAKSSTYLRNNVSGAAGLSKYVSVNGDGIYNDGQSDSSPRNVYMGGIYDYRLRMETTAASKAKDIILYDALEKYVPGADGMDTGLEDQGDIQWKGEFLSVDVSQLQKAGIDPVVYYSTREDLTVDDTANRHDNNLRDASIWSTAVPEDPSEVRAIAIDCTKTADGEDFILESGSSIAAFIRMKAPFDVPDSWVDTELREGKEGDNEGEYGGAHTYNNVVEIATIITETGTQSKDQLIRHDYTKVGLIPFTVRAEKSWDDDSNRDGIRPDSVQVQLLADGKALEGKTAVLNRENQWMADFGKVKPVDESGKRIWYSLAETVPQGYQPVLSASWDNGRQTIHLTNVHKPETITLDGRKIWIAEEDTEHPASVQIDLLRDGEVWQSQDVSARTNWKYSFKDLYRFKNQGQEIAYSVEEHDCIPGYAARKDGNDLINEWNPYGDLVITKTVRKSTEACRDQSFTFTLTLANEDGSLHADCYEYETSDGRKGTIASGDTLTLLHQQTAIVRNIASEVSWKVEEESVKAYQAEQDTIEGSIQAGKTSRADFVNTYRTEGKAFVKAQKHLEGQSLKAGRFSFTLADSQGNIIKTARNQAADENNMAQVLFGALFYENEDDGKTFEYCLTETAEKIPGYTYDQSAYRVTVAVSDNGNGSMDTEIRYFDEAGNRLDDLPIFENRYQASGRVELTAFKKLIGSGLKDRQFGFILKDGSGKEVAQTRNDKDGKIVFSLNFTEEDSDHYEKTSTGRHVFYVEEIEEGIENVVYSRQSLKFVVNVKDNGDGTLNIGAQYEGGADSIPLFINRMADGTLRIEKRVEGENPDPEAKFHFQIRLNPEDEEMEDSKIDASFGLLEETETEKQFFAGIRTEKVTEENTTRSGTTKFFLREETETADTLASPEGEPKTGQIYIQIIDTVMYIKCASAGYEQELLEQVFGDEGISESSSAEDTERILGGGTIYIPNYSASVPEAVPWHDRAAEITQIRVPEYIRLQKANGAGISLSRWFYDFSKVTQINEFVNIDSSRVTNLQHTFRNCSSLLSLDGMNYWNTGNIVSLHTAFMDCSSLTDITALKKWDVSNVTTLDYAFNKCQSLMSLDGLEDWSVSKVKSMTSAFNGLSKINSLEPLSQWDISSVASMSYMFYQCESLTSLDPLSHWDTSSVINMVATFAYCSSLASLNGLNGIGWDVSNVLNMSNLFYQCESLTSLEPLYHWDTASLTNMASAFSHCSSVTSLSGLDGPNWDVGRVTSFGYTFSNMASLVSPAALYNWDTGSATSMAGLFNGCTLLIDLNGLDGPNWDTSKVTLLEGFCYQCNSLADISGVTTWNVGNVKTLQTAFFCCGSLTDISPLSQWDTQSVTIMQSIFAGCSALKSLEPLYKWNTANVTNLRNAFGDCSSLQSLKGLDGPNWNTSNVTTLHQTFYNCMLVTSLEPLTDWDTSSLITMSSTFQKCSNIASLKGLDGPGWNTGKVKTLSHAFEYTVIADLSPLENWNVSNVTDMRAAFGSCINLKDVDALSKWDTGKTASLAYAFASCRALENIDGLKNWDTSSVTDISYMFHNCISLQSVEGTENWNTRNLVNMDYAFYNCKVLESIVPLISWQLEDPISAKYAFSNCSSLRTADLSKWNFSAISDASDFFANCTSLETIVLPADAKNNLSFPGSWKLNKEGSSYTSYTSAQIANAIAKDPDGASGEWIRIISHLYFDPGDGYGSMLSVLMPTVNTDTVIPDSAFYKPGAIQTGWNTQPDGSGKAYASGEKIKSPASQSEDITLYAVWKMQDVEVKSGLIEIWIQAGEYAELSGLPGNCGYSIYEDTADGWNLVSSTSASGNIMPGETVTASYINQYEARSAQAVIQARKMLDDNPASSFRFELSGESLEEAEILLSDEAGMIASKPLLFTKAGTYSYQLRELADHPDDYEYDSKTVNITVEVTDTDGVLQAAVAYDGKQDIPVFSNRTKPKQGTLIVQKTVNDTTGGAANPDQDFTFRAVFSNGIIETFALKNGEEKRFALEQGISYTVEETDLPAGYSSSVTNSTGIIELNKETVCRTVNTYTDSISIVPVFYKELEGKTLEGNDFSFSLTGEYASSKISLEARNTSDGTIYFEPLVFTRTGVYEFEVRETAGDDERIVYDEHAIRYIIRITANPDHPGKLKAEVQYGTDGSDDTFFNTRAKGTLSIQKLLSGAGYQDAANQGETFTVRVQLEQEDGSAWTDKVKLLWPDHTEKEASVDGNGALEIRLKNTESICLEDLPAGTQYLITEIEALASEERKEASAKWSWHRSMGSQRLAGTIEADKTISALLINIPKGDEKNADPENHFAGNGGISNTFKVTAAE